MSKTLFPDPHATHLAGRLSQLAYLNPFSKARIEAEKECLGGDYIARSMPWNQQTAILEKDPNIHRILERVEDLLGSARSPFLRGKGTESERKIYRTLVYWSWFHRTIPGLDTWIARSHETGTSQPAGPLFQTLESTSTEWMGPDHGEDLSHAFACITQIRRAFIHIFRYFIGSSGAAFQLRERMWESIFSTRMERHEHILFARMADFPTLITGPTGSGKEVVARAIGLSRYIPWNTATLEFEEDFLQTFIPVNLSALSQTLLESELFGHRKGAFTGALSERTGYLEAAGHHGSIFLDEIGETPPETQVKLLRVLQTREFNRIGETRSRRFEGKCIAATNRNLVNEVTEGRFREDLYYRLTADCIETPALHLCLQGNPAELDLLTRFILRKLTGDEEIRTIREVLNALKQVEPHSWPGNFRELEQAIRQILIHGSYQPVNPHETKSRSEESLASLNLPLEEIIRMYVQSHYNKHGTLARTARVLGVDPRTIRKYVN